MAESVGGKQKLAGPDSQQKLKNKLIKAAARGEQKTVRQLLESKVDINATDSDNRTAIYQASLTDRVELLTLLINWDPKPDLNKPHIEGYTPLFVAAQRGNLGCIKQLVAADAEVDKQSKNGTAPLYMAAQDGHTECVEELISRDANVNLQKKNGETALTISAYNGHLDTTKCLIRLGADINVVEDCGDSPLRNAVSKNDSIELTKVILEQSPTVKDIRAAMKLCKNKPPIYQLLRTWNANRLFRACWSNDFQTVSDLVEQRINVNVQKKDKIEDFDEINDPANQGITALMIASRFGHTETVQLLREYCTINKAKYDGKTALHEAAQGGHVDIAQMLLDSKADVSLPDMAGSTSLHLCCEYGHEVVVDILLKAEAGVNIKNVASETPFHLAAKGGHQRIVSVLFQHDANIDDPAEGGMTPLLLSAANGHIDTVRFLIENSANSEHVSQTGSNALFLAAENGHSEVVAELLEKNTDVNTPALNGTTPLHAASVIGKGDVIEMLITHKADIRRKDGDEKTALSLAAENGNKRAVHVLMSHKADVNEVDQDNSTVLLRAALANHADVVALLIQNNADVHKPNKNGINALMCAVESSDVSTIVLLVQHHADVNRVDQKGSTLLDIAIRRYEQNDGRILDALRRNFSVPEAKFVKYKDLREVSELSSGNFGITLKAEYVVGETAQKIITMPVVCKIPKTGSGEDDWFELRALQNLPSHPHVLGLIGICTNFEYKLKERNAMIVPFKAGGSLRTFLDSRRGYLPFEQILEFAMQMADGLSHLHLNSYRHCDVAARNFLLTEIEVEEEKYTYGPQCLVLNDFGLSRPLSFTATSPGLIPWRWCAPQVIKSYGIESDYQSDIYMLGVTLWELCGLKRVPFHWIKTPKELYEKCSEDGSAPLIFLSYLATRHPEFIALLKKCCDFEPVNRPKVREVISELRVLSRNYDPQKERPVVKDAEDTKETADESANSGVEYDTYANFDGVAVDIHEYMDVGSKNSSRYIEGDAYDQEPPSRPNTEAPGTGAGSTTEAASETASEASVGATIEVTTGATTSEATTEAATDTTTEGATDATRTDDEYAGYEYIKESNEEPAAVPNGETDQPEKKERVLSFEPSSVPSTASSSVRSSKSPSSTLKPPELKESQPEKSKKLISLTAAVLNRRATHSELPISLADQNELIFDMRSEMQTMRTEMETERRNNAENFSKMKDLIVSLQEQINSMKEESPRVPIIGEPKSPRSPKALKRLFSKNK